LIKVQPDQGLAVSRGVDVDYVQTRISI